MEWTVLRSTDQAWKIFQIKSSKIFWKKNTSLWKQTMTLVWGSTDRCLSAALQYSSRRSGRLLQSCQIKSFLVPTTFIVKLPWAGSLWNNSFSAYPPAIKNQRKAKNAPSNWLWVPWAGSLWHNRAGVATLWATHFITIWNNETDPDRNYLTGLASNFYFQNTH